MRSISQNRASLLRSAGNSIPFSQRLTSPNCKGCVYTYGIVVELTIVTPFTLIMTGFAGSVLAQKVTRRPETSTAPIHTYVSAASISLWIVGRNS
jgi:hypothetical protein